MKILILSNAFPKPFNKLMGTYVYDQVVELKKINKDIFVISPSMYITKYFNKFIKKGKICDYMKLGNNYKINDINVISPKVYQYGKLLRYFPKLEYNFYKIRIIKFLEEFIRENKIELVYAVGTFIEGQLAYDIYKKTGIPYVVTEHSNTNIINSTRNKKLYLKIMKNAKKAFFVSKASQKKFLELYNDISNTEVIVNGFKSESIKNEIKKPKEKFIITSVGFFEERKGWMNLLESINMVKKETQIQIELWIIGDGPLNKKMREYISENNLEDICKFTGVIDHSKVLEYMYASDIFCLVSTNEPLGIVYLEAMSLGIPVIGTKDEGISDIIDNGISGFLVEYGNIFELKELILKLIDNPDILEQIGRNGQRVSLYYSWENNAKQWLDIVNKLN